MKKLTIKILLVLALVAGAVTGSMILTGVSGQPTVQACEDATYCRSQDPPPNNP